MVRLGVLGWPVAHSRSPAIHNAALAALGMEGWRYQLLPVREPLLGETVRALEASGFVGANVTIPHKQAALALADHASDTATQIGAANTLSFADDGSIAAENTDAPGLLAALGSPVRGLRVLVLGAGGSARAAAWAMREAGAAEILVWNRTAARAATLARELRARPVTEPEPADVLINCTAVGMAGEAGGGAPPGGGESPRAGDAAAAGKPPRRDDERAGGGWAGGGAALERLGLTRAGLADYGCVVDLAYGDATTELIAAAREAGAHTVDGLEVLVAQGALSFELWTGRPAPLEVMREAGRSPKGEASDAHARGSRSAQ